MTEKEYRSHSAVSRSDLFKISESPEKFRYYMDNPPEPTEALIFGQLLHKLVLEPETFNDEFCVMPNVDRRTKAGKEEYEKFKEKIADKTIVSYQQFVKASEMTDKLKNNSYVRKLLSGEHEKPYFWIDEMTGEECKCRADCITEINGTLYIIDLKTATSADTDAFMKHSVKYGYHLQAAMYREGVKANTGRNCGFIFIVIEKEPPYSINILQADEIFIKHGYDIFRELIGIYHDCKTTNNWYGYLGRFDNINVLGLPAYLAKEVE